MSTIKNQASSIKVQIDSSRARQTPKTDFGSVFKTGMSKGADAVLSAGKLAAPFIPGGAVVSAAISGMGQLKSSSGAMNAGGGSNSVGISGSGGALASSGSSSTGGGAFDDVAAQAAGGSESAQQMMATREMQEMNQSFNLQYLGMQQKMQSENRQFTLMSNIMKTKHDTAKNAIRDRKSVV